MRMLSLTVLSMVSLTLGAPTSSNHIITPSIKNDIFSKHNIIYSGEYEIENLLVPLNGLNYIEINTTEGDAIPKEYEVHLMVFFIEVDFDSNGNRIEKGIYVIKNGKASKILEHGRDITASMESSKLVFFGTKDGIYIYDHVNNIAVKYGIFDDSIIAIATDFKGDVIYILTEERELFKVTNGGMKKEKINDVVNANRFVLDFSNNIYFYSDDKQAYVRTADGVKKIDGLPTNPSNVHFLKPSVYGIEKDSVPIIVDNYVYVIYANGTSDYSDYEFEPKLKPTTFAPDAIIIQYYANDKKVYEISVFDKSN